MKRFLIRKKELFQTRISLQGQQIYKCILFFSENGRRPQDRCKAFRAKRSFG
ncbi:hypothetical protein WCP94_001587 [Bilophila wadsworthia]